MPYVTTDSLKDALAEFRRRGDERWALKGEVPTDDDIASAIETLLGAGLTPEEVAEVLESA